MRSAHFYSVLSTHVLFRHLTYIVATPLLSHIMLIILSTPTYYTLVEVLRKFMACKIFSALADDFYFALNIVERVSHMQSLLLIL
jgi:hypothetical protein